MSLPNRKLAFREIESTTTLRRLWASFSQASKKRRLRRGSNRFDALAAIEEVEARALLTGVLVDLPGDPIDYDFAQAPLAPVESGQVTGPEQGPFANEDTFKLHSKPDSNYTIYLDFDGHVTEGTTWNAASGLESINHLQYGQGTPGVFSQGQLDLFQAAWARVAEDFAAFDVNVTTEDPGYEALRRDDSGTDTEWGVRAVMTTDTWASCGCGGFAYLNSFDDLVDEPSFTFNGGLSGVSETISHEVGHQLGLGHDGLVGANAAVYYGGHGTGATDWGPIMGGSFGREITQWSDGDYLNASNPGQDDLNVIVTNNGFGYRTDDHGNTRAAASQLEIRNSSSVNAFGIIEQNTDVDFFRFETGAGNVSFDLRTQSDRPNLDLWAGLYNSSGTLIQESNPSNNTNASFTDVALAAGTYYLKVDGVGSHGVYNAATDSVQDPTANQPWQQNPPTGYDDYSSLGQYGISGTIVPSTANQYSIIANSAVKREGNSGTTDYTFNVTRIGNLSAAGSVDWTVSPTRQDTPGDNVKPSVSAADFVGGSLPFGTVSFAANQASQTITVQVVGDIEVEDDETFDVALSNASGGFGYQHNTAEATIIGDESAVSVSNGIQFRWQQQNWNGTGDNWAIDNVTVAGASYDSFDSGIDNTKWVTTSGGTSQSVFTGNATSHLYFNGPRNSGRAAVTQPIAASPGDTLTFDLVFSDGSNGGNATANGDNVTFEYSVDGGYSWELIRTYDQRFVKDWTNYSFVVPTEAALTNVVKSEGTSTTPTSYSFGLVRRDNIDKAIEVDWSVSGVGANPANAADFPGGVFSTGTHTFEAGEETGTIVVDVAADLDLESEETFQLTLDSSTGAIIVLDSRVGTIIDDDIVQDYGDAPSAAQSGFTASYPVSVTDNGARHSLRGARLGLRADADTDGVNSTNADADDADFGLNDEDGVTFTDIIGFATGSDQTGSVDITISNASAAGNFVDAWIDFNQDGDWDDAGEQIFASHNLGTTNGLHSLTFTVPQESGGNVREGTTYARFRLSSTGGLLPTGAAADGEVEDHQVTVARTVPLLFTEIMLHPDSDENAWEWIEIYNDGSVDIDLAGFVLDDDDAPTLTSSNIVSGTLPGDSYAVLYDATNTSADFLQAWRLGINLIPVTNWPELDNAGDTISLWQNHSEYSTGGLIASVESVTYENGSNDWPVLPTTGASIYLSDTTTSSRDGLNWAVSVDGAAGAYLSAALAGNTGNDVGSPGVGPAPAFAPFQRIEPLGSLIFSATSVGTIAADEFREFSVYLEAGQTLNGGVRLDVPGATLTIDVVGLSGEVVGAAGTSVAATTSVAIPTTGTYTVRISSDAAGDFEMSLLRNAVRESTDASDGNELNLDSSLLSTPVGDRWAAIAVSDPSSGAPFAGVQSNAPGKFIDISQSGTFLNVRDERFVNFTSNVGNAFIPAGALSVSDNGVLAVGSGNHGRFINQSLPSQSFTGAAAVPFWDDFFGSKVYWQERLVDGINTLIVQWHQADHFEVSGTDSATFQVQIFESGPLVARYAYQDVDFNSTGRNGGAAATIGLQLDSTRATQFSFNPGSAVVVDGDVIEFTEVVNDADEFTVDLTGATGQSVDVLLTGISGQSFDGALLEVLDTDGTTVLATGTATPLDGNIDATNTDLAVLNFVVPAAGVYTVRVDSTLSQAEYSLEVVASSTNDVENNNSRSSDPLREISGTEGVRGYLDAASDANDYFSMDLTAGTMVTLKTAYPISRHFSPENTLNPELEVFLPDGTLLAANLDSAADGRNALLTFSAATSGKYVVRIGATSGLGEYDLTVDQQRGLVVVPTSLSVPEGGNSLLSVTLPDQPTADVTVTISQTSGDADVTAPGTALTFTPLNWNTPQTFSLAAAEDDDAANGVANFSVSGTGYLSVDVTATEIDNDTQSLVVAPLTLIVAEDGSETFDVTLNAQPLTNVIVTIANTGSDADLTATPSLTFTPSNWNVAQNVTISAADDADADDGMTTFTVASTGLTPVTVTATEDDDDTQSLIVNSASVSVNEGDSNTFSVTLNAQPLADVSVTVTKMSGDIDLTGNTTLTFTSTNWDTPQNVTLSAAEDDDVSNGTATFVVASAGLTSGTVTATEVDNDTQSLVVSPLALSVAEGGSNTLDVSLNAQPESDVIVTVSKTSGDADLTGTATLTFTTLNWNTVQPVTISAAEDADADNGTATFSVSSTGLTSVDVAVTEDDNDTQAVIVSPTALTVGEGTTQTFTVRLAAQPAGTVTVDVARSVGDHDISVDLASLDFTTTDWATEQTITVTAAEDDDADDGTATITASLGLLTADVAVTEDDNDTQAVVVSPASLTIGEGTTQTFTVRLAAQPSGTVTVNVARSSGDGDISIDLSSLDFTPTDWATAQTITVTAAEDDDADDGTATITASLGLLTADVAVTEDDNDTQAVIVSPTSLTIGEGTTQTFTVRLAAQPAGPVNVNVARSSGDDDISVDLSSLDFTTTDWATEQTITVTAAEDDDADDGTATITASLGLLTADVAVTEDDNDTQAVIVSPTSLTIGEGTTQTFTVRLAAQPAGPVNVNVARSSGDDDISVDLSSLDFTTTDWSTAQTITVTAAEDDDADDGTATITASLGLLTADVAVTEDDNDTQAVVVSPASLTIGEGTTQTFTVRLAAQPAGPVNVNVARSSGDGDISVNLSSLDFTTTDWATEQTITVTAAEDDDADDGTATITASLGLLTADVAVTEDDNDTQAVIVSPASLTIGEGTTQTFTVRLAAQPSGPVTVNVARNSGDGDISVDLSSLDFTTTNWATEQAITVTAAEDDDADNGTATITASLGLLTADVAVTEDDNDTQAVIVSPAALTIAEGATQTFTVRLAAQPSGPMSVNVARSSGDDDISVDLSSLDFTTTDWSTAQTITVTAAEDDDADDGTATITASLGLLTADVAVTEDDNDTQAVVVSPASLTIGEGTTQTFTVRLAAQPAGPVNVNVARSSGDGDISVNLSSLDFTTTDWATEQTITVTAAEDDDADDGTATITASLGLLTADVAVTEDDNDTQAVIVSPASLTIGEGTTQTFTVRLAAQPSGPVTVNVARNSGDGDISVDLSSLDFTTTNWATEQAITVTAAEDDDADNGTATITASLGLLTADVAVTEDDNDTQAVIVSPTSLTIGEGTTQTFTVRLAAQPAGTVTVDVARSSGDGDISVDLSSLDFTTTDWATEQTVTVTAGEDDDADDGTATITASLDSLTADVNVTEDDDDFQALVVTPTVLNVAENGSETFSVRLTVPPSGTTSVNIVRTAGDTDLNASDATLVFNSTNWSTAQLVTISASEDADAVSESAIFTLSSGGVQDVEVTATEIDNDVQGIVVAPTVLSVPEGGSANYQVSLAAQPTENVTVNVAHAGGDTDLSYGGASLLFTPTNWQTAQSVEIAAAEDIDVANSTAIFLITSGGLNTVSVTAREADNDVQALVVDTLDISVAEGGITTVGVRLAMQPAGDVTVNTARTLGDSDLATSSTPLTFTTSNWNTIQFVTISAAEDADLSDGTATFTVSSTGLMSVDVTATEIDNDSAATPALERVTFFHQDAMSERSLSPAGNGQRSIISQVEVVIDGSVSTSTGPVLGGGFVVEKIDGGAANVGLNVDSAIETGGKTIVVLSFTEGTDAFGSLHDGNYRFTVNGAALGIDADGFGAVGGRHEVMFHRLYGDSDGDRDVDGLDFVNLRRALGGNANLQNAFDQDQDDDLFDELNSFFQHFGTRLTP